MTTIELRTAIAADLDSLSVEMLESVSRYVKRPTRHSRYTKTSQQSSVSEMEDALQFVKSLSVTGPHQVPSNESGIDALIDEKYNK